MSTKKSHNEILTEFIEIYKSYPCLWKIKSKEYSDRKKKTHAYEHLVKKYSEIEPHANRETVTQKINTIRSCYRKELRKITSSKVRGAKREDVYVPKLWYFDLLSFLNRSDTSHVNTNNTNDSDEGRTSVRLVEDQESTTQCDLTSRKNKRKMKDRTDILIEKVCDKLENEDEFDSFGKVVAIKLRRLPYQQRIFAQKSINDALFEAELDTLEKMQASDDETY